MAEFVETLNCGCSWLIINPLISPLIHLSTVDSVRIAQIYSSTALRFSKATTTVAGGVIWLWHGARPTAQLLDPETTDIST